MLTNEQAPPCRPVRDLAGWAAWATLLFMVLGAAFGFWGRFNKLEARTVDSEKLHASQIEDVRDRLDRIELILLENKNERRVSLK